MSTSGGQAAVVESTARFDTGLVPRAARLEYWNRVNTEIFSAISVDPRSESLHGVLERRKCGALGIGRVYSTAAVVHGGQCIQAANSDSGLLVHMQDLGSSVNTQLRRSTLLRAGDLTFCDASRPYTVECQNPVRMTVIKVPDNIITGRFDSVEQFVGLHVNGMRGGGAILASFIRTIWLHGIDLDTSESCASESLVSALLDLLVVACEGPAEPPVSPNFADLGRKMQAHIERALADPNLSVNSLASTFGVTTRHVHRLFAKSGTAPSMYILERRLDLAARRLRDRKHGDSITAIAFHCGFNDSTAFCRAFRKRYGMAPRVYRREQRER
jgi:AraC-like DNA-binding protein